MRGPIPIEQWVKIASKIKLTRPSPTKHQVPQLIEEIASTVFDGATNKISDFNRQPLAVRQLHVRTAALQTNAR